MNRMFSWSAALAIIFALAAGFVVGVYLTEAKEIPIEPLRFKQEYCLWTWERTSGDLHFVIIPRYKCDRFVRNWFGRSSGESGVSRLEEELGALPSNTFVVWENWPKKFEYPSKAIADRLLQFTKTKGIDLRMNPAFDWPTFPDDVDARR